MFCGYVLHVYKMADVKERSDVKRYLTHDNGGRPFVVWRTGTTVDVFIHKQDAGRGVDIFAITEKDVEDENNEIKKLEEEIKDVGDWEDSEDYYPRVEDYVDHYNNPGIEDWVELGERIGHYTNVPQFFEGEDPERGRLGNSILFGPINGNCSARAGYKYVFVGDSMFSFTTSSPVTDYVSPVRGTDGPLPYAVTFDMVYLMLDRRCIYKSDLKDMYYTVKSHTEDNNPYAQYYRQGVPYQLSYHAERVKSQEFPVEMIKERRELGLTSWDKQLRSMALRRERYLALRDAQKREIAFVVLGMAATGLVAYMLR